MDLKWYEGEVHPMIVSEIMGRRVSGRSYEMGESDYLEWIDRTRMDCVYGGHIWRVGRVDEVDEWGRRVYRKGVSEVGERLVLGDHLSRYTRRLDEVRDISEKADKLMEWNVYQPSMVAVDALGMEKWMLGIGEDPKGMMGWVDKIGVITWAELDQICSDKKPEIVKLTQVFQGKHGFQDVGETGWMYGKEWREYELKMLKESVDLLHSKGKLVSLHCDGTNDEFYQILVDMGVEIIRGWCGQDWYRDFRKWGDKILFNGICSVDEMERLPVDILEVELWNRKMEGDQIVGLGECADGVSVAAFKTMMKVARDTF